VIQNSGSGDEEKVKAALTFGEIGTFKDMSKLNGVMDTISKLF
jgi:hypothetical protein